MIDQASYDAGVLERMDVLAAYFAGRGGESLWGLHASLKVRPDAALADRVVRKALEPMVGGPFDVLPAMMLYCRWKAALPEASRDLIRRYFQEGCLLRGNTENHWLMFYAAQYLAAQEWAGERRLAGGLAPRAVLGEARRWILGTIERTFVLGHHEYDSPNYVMEHAVPLIGLADFAGEEELRSRARDALALLFLDRALEWHEGAWAGGHSREGYRTNTWTLASPVLGLDWLYFGGMDFEPSLHAQGFAGPLLASPYRPPAELVDIAFHGEVPRAVRKTRAPRAILRHADRDPAPVRKYTWMSRSFALGSTQLGLDAPAGPIDLVSWDLGWDAPRHRGKIVCNHPYRSPGRFSAFLTERPQLIGRSVATGKPYLQSSDRLFGASPYERMMQHEGSLIALYRIPASDSDPYVNLYLPKGCDWRERGGWLLADLGRFFAAVRPIGPTRWEEIKESGAGGGVMSGDGDQIDGWLLRIHGLAPGVILEAVEADAGLTFEEYFARRTAMQPDLTRWNADGPAHPGPAWDPSGAVVPPQGGGLPCSGWPQPDAGRGPACVAVRTIGGVLLEMEYDGEHRIDGKPVRYGAWPLYDAPGVTAPLGAGRVTVEHGGKRLEIGGGRDPGAPLRPMRVIG